MSENEILIRMAYNNAWANLRLHRAVGELDAVEYRATRTSFFPSLHLTLAHIERLTLRRRGPGELDLNALFDPPDAQAR